MDINDARVVTTVLSLILFIGIQILSGLALTYL